MTGWAGEMSCNEPDRVGTLFKDAVIDFVQREETLFLRESVNRNHSCVNRNHSMLNLLGQFDIAL